MPITIEQDGKQVEVYTAEEVAAKAADEAKAAAEKATAETTERVRAELASDPNGIAAAARRDAEKKVKVAEKAAADAKAQLEAALADTGKTADEIKAMQEQVKAAKEAEARAAQDVESAKAAFEQKTRLIEAGAKPAAVAKVEALLQADGIDLTNADAVKTAITALKEEAPGLFIDGTPPPYNPSRGSLRPPNTDGDKTPEEVEQMTPAQYEAWRRGKK